jgi:tetratricopeptide (TPR) repeat protein
MRDMAWIMQRLKSAVAAFVIFGVLSLPAVAQSEKLDELFDQLGRVESSEADQIENRIVAEWSKSGSASMDLLLERGRDALEADDTITAIEHFTALIDHAPDFAEGYNARAMAYYRINRYGPAIDDIRQVLQRNPRHFGALGGLALILQELGFEEDALEAWRAVVDLNPHAEGAKDAIGVLEREVEGTSL